MMNPRVEKLELYWVRYRHWPRCGPSSWFVAAKRNSGVWLAFGHYLSIDEEALEIGRAIPLPDPEPCPLTVND